MCLSALDFPCIRMCACPSLSLLRVQVATEKWLLDAGTVRALPREDAPGTADPDDD